jgi:hypothetical protein
MLMHVEPVLDKNTYNPVVVYWIVPIDGPNN